MLTSFNINGVKVQITIAKNIVAALEEKIRAELTPNIDKLPDQIDTFEGGCHIVKDGNSIGIELVDINF